MQHKFCVQDLLPAAACHMPHAVAGRELNHTHTDTVLPRVPSVCLGQGGVCHFNFKANEWPFEQDTVEKKSQKKSSKKQVENPPPKPLKKCPGRRSKHFGLLLVGFGRVGGEVEGRVVGHCRCRFL